MIRECPNCGNAPNYKHFTAEGEPICDWCIRIIRGNDDV